MRFFVTYSRDEALAGSSRDELEKTRKVEQSSTNGQIEIQKGPDREHPHRWSTQTCSEDTGFRKRARRRRRDKLAGYHRI